MEKYAHISEDGRKQTIIEHLNGTAELASLFAKDLNLTDEAYYVGIMHDIGKYSEDFQNRLKGGAKVDHSTAGAYEAFKEKKMIESFCIAGHHAGLPDGGFRSDYEGGSLYARINRAKQGDISNYDAWKEEIKKEEYKSKISNDLISISFVIRMLFSCLVDADYIDTERFMKGQVNRGISFNPDELEKKLENYISTWFPPKENINKIRCNILLKVMQQALSNQRGIYTLTVPTGGGKTVASLAFAIKHAKKYNLKRIIYVIPYTSIIEQTAEVFRNIVGPENVLEHHSNSMIFEDEDNSIYLRASENWDMPIIVTTGVQFFESIYKNKSSFERKLHNIANSVIIFDEAQMLPLQYLIPCIVSITELVKNFGVTAVLCTATQPSLNELINKYISNVELKELCPETYYESKEFKRVVFKDIGMHSFETISQIINNEHQALCIVNSRKAAREIFELLRGEGCYHLSTSMYPLHRKKVIEEVKKRLKNNQSCILISTSLIEAGVDIDFPKVFRQINGLDSILQAAGRCNREGKRNYEESEVTIFDLECGSPELFSVQISACKAVMEEYNSNLFSKEAIKKYFDVLYYLCGEDELDHYEIIKQLKNDFLPFATISEKFNIINTKTRDIYIETIDNKKEIDALKYGFATKMDYRKLGLYSISVYEYQFQKLIDNHSIILLDNGGAVLLNNNIYSEKIGLDLFYESGQGIFI